jgi:hypothetical protein
MIPLSTLPTGAENVTFPITFEYLSKNEGARIQITHSGTTADDVEFIGITKESGPFVDISNQEKSREKLSIILSIFGTAVFTAAVFYLASITPIAPVMDFFHISSMVVGTLIALFLLIFVVVICLLIPYAMITRLILQYKYPPIPEYLR